MSNNSQRAAELIKEGRLKCLIRFPSFGHILLGIDYVETTEIPTAGTDGIRYYYNPDFIAKLTLDEMVFVHAHEVSHIVYAHFGRRGNRHPMLWNMAGDYAINEYLKKNSVGKILKDVLLDSKYDGMIAEEIYDLLVKDCNDSFKKALSQLTEEELAEKFGENFDSHINIPAPEDLTKEEKEKWDRAKGMIRQAAQASSGAGDSTGGFIRDLVRSYDKEQIDWKEYLRENLSSTCNSDYTFTRRAKGSLSTRFYMPAIHQDPKVKVSIAVDTSGSISQADLAVFLGEIENITKMYNDFEIDIWSFDTAVHAHKVYKPHSKEKLASYKPAGGGGTSFEVNWEYMKKKEMQPELFIMFTDGYPCGGWGEAGYCDTIFAVIDNQSARAPFGRVLHISSSDLRNN